MIINLRETTQKNTEQDWLKTNLAKFSSMMQGQKNLDTVGRLIMSQLTPLVSAHHGAFFMMEHEEGKQVLKLTSTYAYRERKSLSNRFQLGESLIGQCALEKKTILLTRVPPDYITISSGLGEAPPLNLIVLPILFEGEVKAVIELASFHPFSAIHQIFLDQLTESIGVVINMISANMRTEQLLQQSQGLTQELQSQSKELTVRARLLEDQNKQVEDKNREVEQARVSIEEKAEQLTLISKYKSEFLANMSHELRTPLNSLLILAKLLSDNKQGNLDDKQIEYARTIYQSGGDLLALINDILDLSKVEAGKMQVEPREISLQDLSEFVERSFRPIADQKGLSFSTEIVPGVAQLRTDPQRLQQVLKNLLSNAFKFTDDGSVKLRLALARPGVRFEHDTLRQSPRVIAFSVSDTGIGIPRSKQQLIFEAFQQADGTTSRRYGGTGLGLSISREISRLLGGEIHVDSQPGVGSTFTLYLPERYQGAAERAVTGARPGWTEPELKAPSLQTFSGQPLVAGEPTASRPVEDDRDSLREGDRTVLIIEDDLKFARIMVGVAREKGFKAVVATRGDTGLAMANELQPDAITLDIRLPVVDGWSVLDRLKRNPRTRHIPVHVISISDRQAERMERPTSVGAFAYLEKPVSRDALEGAFAHIARYLDKKVKRLLLVEDDLTQQRSVSQLLAGEDLEITPVATVEAALAELDRSEYDCLIVDLLLPGEDDGLKLIDEVRARQELRELPIIVYTGKDLSVAEETRLKRSAEAVIAKSGPDSPEQLVKDTALFLHRLNGQASAEEPSKEILDGGLAGRKVLVVDDDVRNIFAISSVLESHQVEVIFAETGKLAMSALSEHPDVDVVLMDVMMPEMDGYETMKAIRRDPTHRSLPIIAITAKALKDDRDKCINAGASDYLPKPIDADKLVELITLWTKDAPAHD
jgi:signal transduction histidine kinase/CheY-like chemotaxis protein